VYVAVHSGIHCPLTSHAGMTQVSQAQPAGRGVASGKSQAVTLYVRIVIMGAVRHGDGLKTPRLSIVVNRAGGVDSAS